MMQTGCWHEASLTSQLSVKLTAEVHQAMLQRQCIPAAECGLLMMDGSSAFKLNDAHGWLGTGVLSKVSQANCNQMFT